MCFFYTLGMNLCFFYHEKIFSHTWSEILTQSGCRWSRGGQILPVLLSECRVLWLSHESGAEAVAPQAGGCVCQSWACNNLAVVPTVVSLPARVVAGWSIFWPVFGFGSTSWETLPLVGLFVSADACPVILKLCHPLTYRCASLFKRYTPSNSAWKRCAGLCRDLGVTLMHPGLS